MAGTLVEQKLMWCSQSFIASSSAGAVSPLARTRAGANDRKPPCGGCEFGLPPTPNGMRRHLFHHPQAGQGKSNKSLPRAGRSSASPPATEPAT
jgi:hypothetical protein